MRKIVAVVVGVVLWGSLWNLGTAGLMAAGLTAPGQPVEGPGVLTALVAYSAVLSALAGYVVGRMARPDALVTVRVFALVQLGIGIAVQAVYWSYFPLAYHLVFLGLVVPATLLGGRWARPARTAPA